MASALPPIAVAGLPSSRSHPRGRVRSMAGSRSMEGPSARSTRSTSSLSMTRARAATGAYGTGMSDRQATDATASPLIRRSSQPVSSASASAPAARRFSTKGAGATWAPSVQGEIVVLAGRAPRGGRPARRGRRPRPSRARARPAPRATRRPSSPGRPSLSKGRRRRALLCWPTPAPSRWSPSRPGDRRRRPVTRAGRRRARSP